MYLDGPLSVGLFEPEPQEPRDRDRHEERLDEGGVVDELVDVVGGEHGERYEALHAAPSWISQQGNYLQESLSGIFYILDNKYTENRTEDTFFSSGKLSSCMRFAPVCTGQTA